MLDRFMNGRLRRAQGDGWWRRSTPVDAVGLTALSWFLSVVALWVLQQAHAGLHEHRDLPPLLHALRDGALAVPIAAASLALSALVVRRRIGTLDGGALQVLIAAVTFAVLSNPGAALHNAVFGAEEVGLPPLTHAAVDSIVALIGALVALIPMAVLSGITTRRTIEAAVPPTADTRLVPVDSSASARSTR